MKSFFVNLDQKGIGGMYTRHDTYYLLGPIKGQIGMARVTKDFLGPYKMIIAITKWFKD